jgi:hypothetical protein
MLIKVGAHTTALIAMFAALYTLVLKRCSRCNIAHKVVPPGNVQSLPILCYPRVTLLSRATILSASANRGLISISTMDGLARTSCIKQVRLSVSSSKFAAVPPLAPARILLIFVSLISTLISSLLKGGMRSVTSFSISVKTPPAPKARTGPNCGSFLHPSSSSVPLGRYS